MPFPVIILALVFILIAGNLLILGAASNVIVIQNAERRSHATLSFWAFARVGIPLTLVQTAIYWGYLRIVSLQAIV